jgi:hypothetical protein
MIRHSSGYPPQQVPQTRAESTESALKEPCIESSRHCEEPNELDNLFDRPDTDDQDLQDQTDQNVDQDVGIQTFENCKANKQGNFGPELDMFREVVEFQYQIQTHSNVSSIDLNDQILPLLEVYLSKLLVPALFQGVCNTQRRKLQSQQSLTGLRATPNDELAYGLDGGNY